MDIEHSIQRRPTVDGATLGKWLIQGALECYTLEDAIREIPGLPVEQWKVKGQTAIPAGRYRLTLEHSGRFGPDTITICDVPGFLGIRVHGGTTIADTEGCPLVGDRVDEHAMTISGGKVRGVLAKLKEKIWTSYAAGDTCSLLVVNP